MHSKGQKSRESKERSTGSFGLWDKCGHVYVAWEDSTLKATSRHPAVIMFILLSFVGLCAFTTAFVCAPVKEFTKYNKTWQ